MRAKVKTCTDDMQGNARQRLALVLDREKFLEDLCTNHRLVAHVGCVDSPYTEARLQDDTLLHSRLLRRAKVVGFDVDATSLEILRRALPEADFVCADIASAVPSEHSGQFDLVIAGEVLEHVGNAAAFLEGCRRLLSPGGVFCVTVPNACSPKIGLRALVGKEAVHPDHRVYFGPRTLRRTLDMSGFRLDFLATYFATQPSRAGRLFNRILWLSHRLFEGPVGEGLIALAYERRLT